MRFENLRFVRMKLVKAFHFQVKSMLGKVFHFQLKSMLPGSLAGQWPHTTPRGGLKSGGNRNSGLVSLLLFTELQPGNTSLYHCILHCIL